MSKIQKRGGFTIKEKGCLIDVSSDKKVVEFRIDLIGEYPDDFHETHTLRLNPEELDIFIHELTVIRNTLIKGGKRDDT